MFLIPKAGSYKDTLIIRKKNKTKKNRAEKAYFWLR